MSNVNGNVHDAGAGQSNDLTQVVMTLQSTLLEFQRRNEEAQRRAQESQAAMMSVLSAFMQESNGAVRNEDGSLSLPPAAEQILRNRQVLACLSAPAQPVMTEQSERKRDTSTGKKSNPQKQLLELLQALQANASQDDDSAAAAAVSAVSAVTAQARPAESFDGRSQPHRFRSARPTIASSTSYGTQQAISSPASFRGGLSSPPLASVHTSDKSSGRTSHKRGIQSSPVLRSNKSGKNYRDAALAAPVSQDFPYHRHAARRNSTLETESQSPILGGLTPGYEAEYLSGPSPTYSVGGATTSSSFLRNTVAQHANAEPSSQDSTKEQCCYNCGVQGESGWRYVAVSDETQVRHYDQSVCVVDGTKNFRACNACGMYFAKFKGVSRPEYIWRKSSARKMRQNNKRSLEETTSSSTSDDEDRAKRTDLDRTKRAAFARTLSEACAIDSKRIGPGAPTVSEKGKNGGARNGQLPSKRASNAESSSAQNGRLSSSDKGKKSRSVDAIEATDSDEDTPSSSRGHLHAREKAKRVFDFQKARLKDFVLDSRGQWRTKRSILENPTGRRVGRPAGMKTGEGEGRQRSNPEKKAEALRRAKIEVERAKLLIASRMGEVYDADADSLRAKSSKGAGKIEQRKVEHPATPNLMEALQAILSASSPSQVASHDVRPDVDRDGFTLPRHHNGVHSTPGAPSMQYPTKTPLSMNKARYGAPAHLLNSSPATAFQTVMDEADTDWKALFNMGAVSGTPRRSPRKKPPGTHAMVNPYATSILSPSAMQSNAHFYPTIVSSVGHPGDVNSLPNFDAANANVDANMLMQMTSSSPLTRGRVRSGQFGWAWTSSDDVENGKKKTSSAITSPASPSPTRPRASGAKRKANVMLEAGPLDQRDTDGKVTRQSHNRTKQQQVNGPSALNAGPFMGLDTSDPVQPDDEDEDEGPGSPTLGRSRRLGRKKREELTSSSVADTVSPAQSSFTPVDSVNQHATSGNVASAGNNGSSLMDLSSVEWTRASSMRDLFPNLSPDKKWNVASPSHALWNSPTSWALRMPTPSPVKALPASKDAAKANRQTPGDDTLASATVLDNHLKVKEDTSANEKVNARSPPSNAKTQNRRKPLPATVEDATPSDANGSPFDGDEDDDEDEDDEDGEADESQNGNELVFDINNGANMTELMSMFEDPYGLLAASGINLTQPADKQDMLSAVPTPQIGQQELDAVQQNGQQPATTGDPTGLDLSHIELFKTFDFGQHLDFLNETGANGMATSFVGGKTVRTSPRKHAGTSKVVK